jgi:hypothetical protein
MTLAKRMDDKTPEVDEAFDASDGPNPEINLDDSPPALMALVHKRGVRCHPSAPLRGPKSNFRNARQMRQSFSPSGYSSYFCPRQECRDFPSGGKTRCAFDCNT